jgi:hypothetical protein
MRMGMRMGARVGMGKERERGIIDANIETNEV